jgi:hypothetical protein
MSRFLLSMVFVLVPMVIFGGDNEYDTINIKPIGVDYSKYSGTNKLFMVGECDGKPGNQIVIFQNRPSFDYFENDEAYLSEQKELEKAIWKEILDHDMEPMLLKGRWHRYQDRVVFLCHQILKMDQEKIQEGGQERKIPLK